MPTLVIVWGIVLLAAFALEQWPRTPSLELQTVTSDGPGLLTALANAGRAIATALAILGAAAGLGGVVTHLGFGSLGFGRTADFCGELMLGGGALAIAVFGLGHGGMLTLWPMLVLLVLGWTGLVVSLRRDRTVDDESAAASDSTWRDPFVLLALLAIATAGVVALVTALAPPTARDALSYHLAAPKAYVAANGIVELPWNVLSYTPFAAEMLFTAGLVIGPDTSPGLVHLGVGVALVVLVVSVARRVTGSIRWGMMAGAVVASVPSIVWNAGIAHNEMWMALALTVAFVAIGQWWERGDRRLLLWCGAAVGVALAAKHTALLLAPLLALIVLVRARSLEAGEQRRTLRFAFEAALIAVAIPLPWYLQNFTRTSNPLFPYFWGAFPTKSSVWDATRAELLESYLRGSYGQSDGVAAWLRLPWDVSIRAQSDVTVLFDGVIGPIFLFLTPLIVLAIIHARVPSWLRVATGLAYAFLVIWATQSQQIRFLLPVLPLLAIAGLASATRTGSTPVLSRAVTVTTAWLVGALVAMNLAVGAREGFASSPHLPVLGLESRTAYLERRLPYFRIYDRLHRELGPAERVMLVNMRNDGYYLDVPFVSDSVFEDFTVGRIVNDSTSTEAIREGMSELGVTHLLVREDILLDPRFTPFEDATASARWADFLANRTQRLESGNGMALYALKN